MGFKRKHRILSSGKSPSFMAMNRTRLRAILGGGVTQDFTNNIENLREIMRKLSYTNGQTFFQDCPFVYVPSSYGEGKNFAQVQNKRNLVLWSEDFSNAVWLKGSATVSVNTTLNPFGLNKSYYLIDNSSLSGHYVYERITVVIGQRYTTSFYIKKADDSWIQLAFEAGFAANVWINFNFDTGLFGNSGGLGIWTVEQVANGYYKIVGTASCGATGSFSTGVIVATNNTDSVNPAPSYVGTLRKYCDVAAVQTELGSYATPYQKTVAAGDGIVDFNFTRATASTVTNKQGVIEGSCYNLLQRSEEFDNGIYTKVNTTISANNTIAPNGTLTADKILETTASGNHFITQSSPLIAGVTYTASCYLKAAERTEAVLQVGGGSAIYINLLTGAVFGTLGTVTYTITPLPDGWFRCTLTTIPNTTANFVVLASLNGNASYVGVATNGIYIWGAQLVQGSTPRPYLRTTNRLNVPKLDYSRGIGEPELLIEPQRINLLLQSEDFNTTWTKVRAVVNINSIVSPSGVLTADKLVADTSNNSHFIQQTSSFTAGNIVNISCYAKLGEYGAVSLETNENSVTFAFSRYDLVNGTLGASSAGLTNISIVAVGSGWYRCSFSKTIVTTGVFTLSVSVLPNVLSGSFVGNNVDGIYIWGAQLEVGSNATTYIPTTTATVTRNAETSYVDLFNNAVLSQNNWTLYYEGYLLDGQTAGMSVCLSDTNTATSNTNQIGWYNKVTPFYNVSNVRTNSGLDSANNSLNKLGIQYNNGSVTFYRNGVSIWTQSVVSFNYRYLILNSGGSTFATDKLMLFNRTLTNSEMTTITT